MPPKRKAAISTKAKSTAAIAAAESKEDETAAKAKKAPSKHGRPKKKPSSPEPDKDEDDVEVIDGDTPDVCQMPIKYVLCFWSSYMPLTAPIKLEGAGTHLDHGHQYRGRPPDASEPLPTHWVRQTGGSEAKE
ncbi:hypothetical protein B0H10DRAFT_1969420 [Mycena sp. CBHHK59/15]|nr:hypothetical protein B0H10DRAFT_1969420 [Mycena sp. CBHHK59/15]